MRPSKRRTPRLQIIGVLDLLGGRAVHARGGARDRYAPVQNAAGWPIDPGNAQTLAEIYTDVLGISEIYAADLDAILDQQPQDEVTRASLRCARRSGSMPACDQLTMHGERSTWARVESSSGSRRFRRSRSSPHLHVRSGAIAWPSASTCATASPS